MTVVLFFFFSPPLSSLNPSDLRVHVSVMCLLISEDLFSSQIREICPESESQTHSHVCLRAVALL